MMRNKVRIQKQIWDNYTHYILINKGASVQIEITDTPQWFGGNVLIYALYADEDKRRKGYATNILDEAEKLIKELGYNNCFIIYKTKLTEPFVLEFYKNRGYEVIDMYPYNKDFVLIKNFGNEN